MAIEEALRIEGGYPLNGEIEVSGGKNAAVAIIPASLLAGEPCVIENLPDVDDVIVLIEMLRWLGAKVEFENGVMRIDPRGVSRCNPPYELARRMRASYYLVPVLTGLFGQAEVPLPGGCDIGARPIDQTIKGLSTLGVKVDTMRGALVSESQNPAGAEVYLDMPSVGATVNTMLMAVMVPGNTTIVNAAKEPHIVDLANFLGSMGAYVKGAGTDVIRIRGGRKLHGSTYTIIPDQIETGTLMIAAAAAGGDVTITGAIPTHMEALSAKLLEMGVYVHDEDDRIRIRSNRIMRPVNVKTQVYPGYPTDLQQPITALLTMARGSSVITETIYEARYKFVEELRRMGANIRVIDRVAIVDGVPSLTGCPVTASDLRAGAALIVAGLMAEGVTEISNLKYIARGYERIDKKLRHLGAHIERIQLDK
jgi:UDP-N-acetylglucosamine 1-carboxyvinyltransferase